MTCISPRSHFSPIKKKSYKVFCKNWKNLLNWGKFESPEFIPVAFGPHATPKQNLPQMHPPRNKPQDNFLKQICICNRIPQKYRNTCRMLHLIHTTSLFSVSLFHSLIFCNTSLSFPSWVCLHYFFLVESYPTHHGLQLHLFLMS